MKNKARKIVLLLVVVTILLSGCSKEVQPPANTLPPHPPPFMPRHPPSAPNQSSSPQLTHQSSQTSTVLITTDNIPQFVHHNFIDLDKIAKISKFRSGVGHDFSTGSNETRSCRSMKHYLEQTGLDDAFWSKLHQGGITKEDWPRVKYYAPINGTIIDMRPATNMYNETENQFILQSQEYPSIWFGFFHVITKKGLQVGSTVTEGDFLGTISPGNTGEIAVSIVLEQSHNNQAISFFQVLANDSFEEYKARGVTNRSEFLISKEYRDAHPLLCDPVPPYRFIGNWFTSDKNKYDDWSRSEENWVFLTNK